MRYSTWKTMCVGRFLVDVPTTLDVTYNPIFQTKFQYGELIKKTSSFKEIQHEIETNVHKLVNAPHDTKGKLYIDQKQLNNGAHATISWKHKGNNKTINIVIYIPIYLKDRFSCYIYTAPSITGPHDTPLSDILAFASSFKPREKDTIPTEPGFCIDDAIITHIPDTIIDECFIKAQDPIIFSSRLTFSTKIYTRERRWLTEQTEILQSSWRSLTERDDAKIEKLRFGRRAVGSLLGEEAGIKADEYDNSRVLYRLEWEKPPVPNSKTEPFLYALLYYGGKFRGHEHEPSPYASDEEALATWDRFVSSIRPRPVG